MPIENVPKMTSAGDKAFAPKVLLIGEPGSGKTFSAALAALQGINVRFLFTEPGMDTLTAASFPKEVRSMVGKSIHYCYLPTSTSSFEEMIARATQVGQLSFDMLKSVKETGRDKKTGEFIDVLRALNNYTSDITGENFGSVDTWGAEDMLVLDSLSGLNVAALRLAVGTAPSPSQAEWGVAMQMEEGLLTRLCQGCRCWFVLTAHPEPEVDENASVTRIYPGALGRKNGPKLGRFFSEVIETRKEGDKFLWATMNKKMALKTRNLPHSENLKPDWKPLVDAFKSAAAFNVPDVTSTSA